MTLERFTVEDYLRYVEGELPARQAAELEAYVADNKEAHERLEKARHLVEQLAADEPDMTDVDIGPSVWRRVDSELGQKKPMRMGALAYGVLGAAAACIIAIVALPRVLTDTPGTENEWRVKSTAAASLAGVELYRQTDHGTERIGPEIRRDHRLLVAYRNLDQRAYSHLMVFAIAESGEVFWYYPAFTDPKTDPTSISIVRAESAEQLPDAIRHELQPGRMAVYALFSKRRYRVSEIEAVSNHGWQDGFAQPLPLGDDDALQQVHELQVK